MRRELENYLGGEEKPPHDELIKPSVRSSLGLQPLEQGVLCLHPIRLGGNNAGDPRPRDQVLERAAGVSGTKRGEVGATYLAVNCI